MTIIDNTVDPTVTDDSSNLSVKKGDIWINSTTGDSFLCSDPAPGAANWDSVGARHYVDVLVTSAEVLALNATPIEILPAVGAGFYPEFIGAYVFLDFNSAGYVDDAGEDLVFQNLSGGDEVSHSADGTLFDGTADALVWMGPKGGEAGTTQTLIDNGGIEVTIQTGEWITGDSPLKIRLFYRLVTKADLEAIA